MLELRRYGAGPVKVAVIHGGPGAAGEMAPVAETISRSFSVIEPFQSRDSVDGLVEELRDVLVEAASQPVTLIGHSWGAWLSVLVAAEFPDLVRKLVLVASGPFEERYADGIMPARIARLADPERAELIELMTVLDLFRGRSFHSGLS